MPTCMFLVSVRNPGGDPGGNPCNHGQNMQNNKQIQAAFIDRDELWVGLVMAVRSVTLLLLLLLLLSLLLLGECCDYLWYLLKHEKHVAAES